MKNEMIARRYATALADVVVASGDAETVGSELGGFRDLFSGNAELAAVFGNPSIGQADKSGILNELIKRAAPSKTTANFLKVLSQNGRLNDLEEITERFETVLEERRGVVPVDVTSARELPSDERAGFEKHLEQLTGKRVNARYSIDADIIGGVITRIGSTVYDDSVKTKLARLKEELING